MNEQFLTLLAPAIAAAPRRRPCPEFPDDTWLTLGVQRVLDASESVRVFLHEHGPRFAQAPRQDNYFAAVRSQRRRELTREVGQQLRVQVQVRVADRLADLPELARYAVFAADAHWHQAAAHDPRHEDRKMAVGHFYSLDRRISVVVNLFGYEVFDGGAPGLKCRQAVGVP